MKLLIVRGGLGNQMFQYALYLQLLKMGKEVTLDLSPFIDGNMHNGFELQKIFTLNGHSPRFTNCKYLNYVRRILSIGGKPGRRHGLIYFEGAMKYGIYKDVFTTKAPIIEGYFQSEEYFPDVEEEVRQSFRFLNIDEKNKEIATEMRTRNSVSIHIRRGDYIACGMKIMGLEYYKKAIERIKSLVDSPYFYIFSDDATEADNIARQCSIAYTLINHNTGIDSYKDMYLMSNCKHNIIANSSFSWWGAWLNANPQKIVVSPLWGKHFHCKKWTLVEN